MKQIVKIILFLLCFFSLRLVAVNDSTLKKNFIYLELFGNGIKGSINYDRMIKWKKLKFMNDIRIGLGYDYSGSDDSLKWTARILVTELNFLSKEIGIGQFEIGVGYSYYIDPLKYYDNNVLKEKKDWSVSFLRLGYRIQREHVVGRVALMPTFSREFWNDKKYSPGLWFGISLGYCF